MGATVIDSFVVELGLDPSKFNANQKKVVNDFKKGQDELESRAKNTEKSASGASDALGMMTRQAAGLFAVFSGGKSITGFATSINTADAAVGRLSRNLNVNASTISQWQGVARIFGGSAEGMAKSFTEISDAVEGFKVGNISPMIANFRALSSAGGTVIDANEGVAETLMKISANLSHIARTDPARAGYLGRMLGLDPGMYDLLVRGPEATKKMLDNVKGLGPATKESADAAGDLEQKWGRMRLSAEGLGRVLLGKASGPLGSFFDDWTEIFAAAKEGKLVKGSAASKLFGSKDTYSDNREIPASLKSAATSAPAGGYSGGSTGGFSSQDEKAQYIRATALKYGIDPEVALKVAKTEGFYTFKSSIPGENSYGAFQLNRSKTSRPSLGDMFAKDTGLDPSDPNTEKQGIDYALKYAATSKRGWKDWYGAANNGIGQFAGIPASGGGNNTTTVEQINVYTQPGADGRQIGNDIRESMVSRQSRASNANTGPQ